MAGESFITFCLLTFFTSHNPSLTEKLDGLVPGSNTPEGRAILENILTGGDPRVPDETMKKVEELYEEVANDRIDQCKFSTSVCVIATLIYILLRSGVNE